MIKSFCRCTAVEHPDRLGRVTQVLAIRQKQAPAPQPGHLAGDQVKALLAEPGTATARAVRDTVPTSHSPRTPCPTGPRTRPCSAGSTR